MSWKKDYSVNSDNPLAALGHHIGQGLGWLGFWISMGLCNMPQQVQTVIENRAGQ